MKALKKNQPHLFDPSILREYDIRGLVGKTLDAKDCYAIGRAFGSAVSRAGGKTVCIAWDGRESSPEFAAEMQKGLAQSGLDVFALGLGPTPMSYFAMKNNNLDAAVVITGSHSPLAYNGIKMALKDRPFYGDDIQSLGRMASSGDFVSGDGAIRSVDVVDDYVGALSSVFTARRPLTVAWDCGNGAAGAIIDRLVAKLPGRHTVLFGDVDGRFPNHHPDPTVAKNLRDLQKAVRDGGCDIGIGFDGDADRVGAVDENGNILWADMLMALYAAEVLADRPGATVIADVKCSQVLFDEIRRLGGKPLMWKTGHSVIKAKMKETGAPLGGELAGHICFADKYYGFDDAPYAAVRLLNLLSQSGKPLSALTAHLPSILNTPEIRFHVPAERKFAIAPEILARLKQAQAGMPGLAINDIDGVRVTTEDGWWLMRPSNTEDVLTLRVEAYTQEGLNRLKKQLEEQLAKSGISSPFST